MNAERQRILELVASGQLSPEDAERLLDATRKARVPLRRWLFQPLELFPTGRAMAIAAVAAVASLAVARLGVRFDGALDLHLGGAPVPWGTAVIDLLLAWPVTALVLWAVARPFAGKGRLVDFLAGVGVARVVLVVSALLLLPVAPAFEAAAQGTIRPMVLVAALALLPLVAWFVALLVTGMRTASGLRGGKLAIAATVGILAAEIVTKVALAAL